MVRPVFLRGPHEAKIICYEGFPSTARDAEITRVSYVRQVVEEDDFDVKQNLLLFPLLGHRQSDQ
jgi:hypothetical protein